MMKASSFLLFSMLIVSAINSHSQNLIVKQDTIAIESDTTAVLNIQNARGNIIWQISYDNQRWYDFVKEGQDSVSIYLDTKAYYRAKVTNGTCYPVYSDTVFVEWVNDYDSLTTIAFDDPHLMLQGEPETALLNGDTIFFIKVNDEYFYQGDIVFTEDELEFFTNTKGASIPTNFFQNRLWPEGKVYYTIASDFLNADRVLSAINYWKSKKLPLEFILLTEINQPNYIEFVNDSSISSSRLGMAGGQQLIRIASSAGEFTVRHEIGHAIGLIHEQSRADRDSFIIIKWENIIDDPDYRRQFEITKNSYQVGSFDFESLMLYMCKNQFGIDPSSPTMVNKITGEGWDDERVHRYLSKKDQDIIRALYSTIPSAKTGGINIISDNMAACYGNVVNDGGYPVTDRGICWDSSGNPTITSDKYSVGPGIGRFVGGIVDLKPNTTYYVRAYATNKKGTAYGAIEKFSTIGLGSPPTVSTGDVSVYYYLSPTGKLDNLKVFSRGEVVNEGGFPVESRGVCWYIGSGPTTADDFLADYHIGKGSFKIDVSDVIHQGADLYLRAFAKNLKGTSYGNEIRVRIDWISEQLPQIFTEPVTHYSSTSAKLSGIITSGTSFKIVSKGFCWNTTGNPTPDDHITLMNSPEGYFSSEITDLNPATDYYIRAFIKLEMNGYEFYYFMGDEVRFTTLAVGKPALTTAEITGVTKTGALSGGNITDDGGVPVILRGVCWSTSPNPTISNDTTINGSGLGMFTSTMTNLQPNTRYYVQAYATSSHGTGYGQQETFTTSPALPQVSTQPASNITENSVTLNATVHSDGGAGITMRGFYWCQGDKDPTDTDSIAVVSGTLGSYSKNLSGLKPGTLYSFKSFATNSAGTDTGDVYLFATDPEITGPVVTTLSVTDITIESAKLNGTVVSDGGAAITERGFYWSATITNPGPTAGGTKATVGGTTGNFEHILSGLQSNTKYYVTAYAINKKGTTSGNVESFTTSPALPQVSTQPASNITENSVTLNATVHSDGGAGITMRGFYWCQGDKDPTDTDSIAVVSGALGSYSKNLSGLKPGTLYSYKSFATNSTGTNTGDVYLFATDPEITVPVVTTLSVTDITIESAKLNGTVVSDGGAAITECGFYWSPTITNPGPTAGGTKVTVGGTTGSFEHILSGLQSNTKYYVTAYATNKKGATTGNVESFTTSQPVGPIYGTFTDARDSKVYKTVKIGNQTWMAENLAYLPSVSPASQGSETTPVYYVYNYHGSDVTEAKTIGTYIIFGVLYNWPAAMDACPAGWHLPSDAEWTQLENFLIVNGFNYDGTTEGNKIAKSVAATTNWATNSGIGTIGNNLSLNNNSGFSGLPGGHRSSGGSFWENGYSAYWWSSTETNTNSSMIRYVFYGSSFVSQFSLSKAIGLSVRCVRD